jgi:hypothetical protein
MSYSACAIVVACGLFGCLLLLSILAVSSVVDSVLGMMLSRFARE